MIFVLVVSFVLIILLILVLIVVLILVLIVLILVVILVIILVVVAVVKIVLIVHYFIHLPTTSIICTTKLFIQKLFRRYSMKNLPTDFLNAMSELLTPYEYSKFIVDCSKEPYRGIRINTLKCSVEKAERFLPFQLEPTPFCEEGRYIPYNTKGVGDEPFHRAGAFYAQEPSATSAVTVLDVQPGDKVLDLCAAPGGKSTQIAAKLNGSGLLWSNEYVRNRANILLSNIERIGISNAVVSSCHPDVLCTKLEGYFDKVLVDAPCSGEGMFRKDENAVEEWSLQHSISCGERQLSILKSASKAVRGGGTLVYSTCTFSVHENENVIERFLEENNDFELIDCGVSFGHRAMDKAVRILPSDGGEGHFAAKLRKRGDTFSSLLREYSDKSLPELSASLKLYDEIFKSRVFGDRMQCFGDKILILPNVSLPRFEGLGVIRAGLAFGEIKKNRIEPCHALFMASKKEELKSFVDLEYSDIKLRKFYHGEEIEIDSGLKGFTAVLVEGVATGFGKASSGVLKNRCPKGLRVLG